MNKIWLIIQREYLTRVKKKSFLLTTILVPLVIIGFYTAIIAIAISDDSEKVKVGIIDKGNLFDGKIPTSDSKDTAINYVFINEPAETFQKKYVDEGYKAFLDVPVLDMKNPEGIKLHSRSTISIAVKAKIDRIVDKAIERKRL